MKLKRKIVVPVLALAVVLLGVLFAFGHFGGRQTEGETIAKPVETFDVQPADVIVYSDFSARIDPETEVQVLPQASGEVKTVDAEVGQQVEAGDPLVTLEDDAARAQVEQAQAALAQAMNAEAAARNQIEQSRVAAENAKKDYDRTKALFDQGAVSQQQLEQVEAQYLAAQGSYDAAKQQLEPAADGGFPRVEAGVKQAQASLELAQLNLEHTVVRAPAAGLVSAVNVDAGDMAAPAAPVATVVDMDNVVARANITEKDVGRLGVGQEVNVVVEAASDKPFAGKISSLSPAASAASKTWMLEVEVPNPGLHIKPGMSAVVTAAVEQAKHVLAVPIDAVIERDGNQVVFVVEDDHAVARQVFTGVADDTMTEITVGLHVGDRVVVAGQEMLNDGDQIMLSGGGDQ